MEQVKYVVGFLFSTNRRNIMLIRKQHPKWQKGKLNGVGGVIQEDETPAQAMKRECFEESGIDIEIQKMPQKSVWQKFALVENDHFELHCFRAFSDQIFMAETKTEERIVTLPVDAVIGNKEAIYNLQWMIPMALDTELNSGLVRYRNGT